MSTFQYEVFIEVVDSGSFTKTGEKLGLSQSGVSHNISVLEKELGLVLLNRNRNGISLTDAGKRIAVHIRDILFHANLLKQEAALLQGIQAGNIKIGSFPSFSEKILPKEIRAFRKLYPHIHIDLYEGGYEEIKNWIISGTVDIGFITLPSSGLESIPLMEDDLVAIVPEGHPLASSERIHLKSLENQPFIMPKDGCDVLLKSEFRKAKVQPKVEFEIKDNHTILSMVKEQFGMSVVPEMILPKQLEKIRVIPFQTKVSRTIGVAFKSMKHTSPAVKRFIDLLESK